MFGCDEVDLVSFLPIKAIGGKRGTRLNDVWGWTDSESGNREYAIVGPDRRYVVRGRLGRHQPPLPRRPAA